MFVSAVPQSHPPRHLSMPWDDKEQALCLLLLPLLILVRLPLGQGVLLLLLRATGRQAGRAGPGRGTRRRGGVA